MHASPKARQRERRAVAGAVSICRAFDAFESPVEVGARQVAAGDLFFILQQSVKARHAAALAEVVVRAGVGRAGAAQRGRWPACLAIRAWSACGSARHRRERPRAAGHAAVAVASLRRIDAAAVHKRCRAPLNVARGAHTCLCNMGGVDGGHPHHIMMHDASCDGRHLVGGGHTVRGRHMHSWRGAPLGFWQRPLAADMGQAVLTARPAQGC